jgi:signal transduction histidine kinase/ActR/RegA family two-component response regulator
MSKLAERLAQLDHERRILVTQTTVLESVARGEPLPDVLEQLCKLIEGHCPGSLCSVLLLEESSGTLRAAAGPSLPREYAEALDGMRPGEGAGSCGTAAARAELVIVADTQSDPLWESFREFALRFDIRSCWSIPIFGPDGRVLGTFAISPDDPREPTPEQLALLRTAGHLAGIALERDEVRRRSEQLYLELHNQQRLESLGVLAGGIAHDFNNLMTAVLGNISLAAARVDDAEARGCLRAAEEACEQSRILSGRFLSFAKGGSSVREPVDLADVVRAGASFALAGSDLTCEWSGDDSLPAVQGERSQLLQVVSNLLINADQATPGGGTVTVAAEVRDVERGDGIGLEAGRYVVLSVRDRGRGIAPHHLDRIFDPYFTLRDGGSGLGLATVYSIVRTHGGRIEVASQPGQGTTFEVILPAANEPAHPKSAAASVVTRSEGRVLVMDDEPAVLRVATSFLRHAGYQVEGAPHGDEALARFCEAHEKDEAFDAVVLDLTVRQGMGGEATIEQMRAIDPDIAAVVASGYSIDDILASPEGHGFDAAVAKPFGPDDLAVGVRRALEARGR